MDVQPSSRSQSGFSMIEVMIAFFVLSVGLLGIAGLHLTSLRDNTSALLRSRATVLAADMMDRIRANTLGLDDYAVDFAGDGVNGQCHAVGATAADDCTASDMALHDIWTWKRLISDRGNTGTEPPTGLPEGKGKVVVLDDAATPALKTVTVTLEWKEGDVTLSLSASTQIWPAGAS